MNTLLKFIRRHLYPLLLLFITIVISIANYTPGTWLSGWDTLHPEFNFSLNFERIINGVWREEQGLGALAVHSHMSELPRYIFLWFMSWIVPLSSLRYLYIFLCFIVGPLGVYYFLRHVLRKKDHEGEHLSRHVTNASAFLGALAYIFNIATLHHFSVPFEMFPTQYAFLPWLFLFLTRFLETGRTRELLYFSVVTFLATPMAYAAQLWYAYFGGIILYSVVFVLRQKGAVKTKVKAVALPILLTLLINSFWLLPHLYQITTTASWIPRAHVNELFSERMFAYNKARGTIWDVAVLRGSLYDWTKYNGEKFVPLFDDWEGHMDQTAILVIGYLVFGMVVIGLFLSVRHKNAYALAFVPVGFMAMAVLMNMNPPFDLIFGPLRDTIPLFREALRSPYTKFSILILFVYCFYFAYALRSFLENAHKNRKYIVTFTAVLLVLYMLPFFRGLLIDPEMRVKIPNEYFDMFRYFEKQPKNERIATVPYHTFWAWEYYQFGYQGAGFLWFGLPQSILVRDFDRWNPGNENFYWEVSQAVYSQNYTQLEQVLTKYRVSWLIIDQNTVSPDSPKTIYYENIKTLFDRSSLIRETQRFGNLVIYRVDIPVSPTFKYTGSLPSVAPAYTWNNHDQAYIDGGDYINSTENATVYPFRSLFSGKKQVELEYAMTENPSSYTLSPKTFVTPKGQFNTYSIRIPAPIDEIVEWDNLSDTLVAYSPTVVTNGQALQTGQTYAFSTVPPISITIPKVSGFYTFDNMRDINMRALSEQQCSRFQTGDVSRFMMDNRFLRLTSTDASNCLDLTLANLPHRYSYLVRVESRNNSGSPLLFSVINKTTGKTEIQTYLPASNTQTTSTFIIPPLEYYGLGYSLHFDNISIGGEKTSNDIGLITAQPFPYHFVHNVRFDSSQGTDTPVFALSQSYNSGWLAYETPDALSRLFPILFGKRLDNHVMVNNWANGWVLRDSVTNYELRIKNNNSNEPTTNSQQLIAVVYWPQYLEYLGFGLLVLAFSYLAYSSFRRTR